MANKDWEKELAKIDKQLESVSDEQLFPKSAAKTTSQQQEIVEKQSRTSTLGVMMRLLLAVALGIGMIFWPYQARCGLGLLAYLFAVVVLIGAGGWSAVWAWRHRAGKAHVLSLLIVVWGTLLGAQEILPRTGYAKPTLDHPSVWQCE
jgi:Flp pilus assembly protein TadB